MATNFAKSYPDLGQLLKLSTFLKPRNPVEKKTLKKMNFVNDFYEQNKIKISATSCQKFEREYIVKVNTRINEFFKVKINSMNKNGSVTFIRPRASAINFLVNFPSLKKR